MKRIYLSLTLSILAAVFGLGFLLNGLYKNLQTDELDLSSLPELAGYRHILERLSNAQGNQQQLIHNAQTLLGLPITLTAIEQLALPDSLHQHLLSGQALVLAEQDQQQAGQPVTLSLYLYSNHLQKLLSVSGIQVTLPSSQWRLEKFIFTLMFYLGLCLALVIWLAPLVQRLAKLHHAARDFGEGNLSARVSQTQLSYINELEKSFNTMAERIETLICDNKLLSRAVSHDLKTPLARLRFGVDMLMDRDEFRQSKQLNNYRKRLDNDLNEMQSLIDSLLEYAKLDQHQLPLNFQPIQLNSLLSELINTHQTTESAIDFINPESSITINADNHYLKRLLNNLMENALRFAQDKVRISLDHIDQQLILSFENDGAPLSLDECQDIFKPFIRGQNNNLISNQKHNPKNNQKNQAISNHGMGLAICERIAKWHHASIHADNSPDLAGARFQVIFPTIRNHN